MICPRPSRLPTLDGPHLVTPASGRFQEKFFALEPAVTYNVVVLTDQVAVEYDCGVQLGLLNYCVHVMACTPTLPAATVAQLVSYAEGLGLNPLGLNFTLTVQTGCW